MWVASPPKWRKVAHFSYPTGLREGEKMEIYKIIHGDGLEVIQRAKRFIVSV